MRSIFICHRPGYPAERMCRIVIKERQEEKEKERNE
jgi:hypothetical protein